MAVYPDPWDVATPAGTEERRQGDDRIRELKRALQQRLDTFVNYSTSLDDALSPVRPKANTIPPGALQNDSVVKANIAPALKAELRTTLTQVFTPTVGLIAAGAEFTETVAVAGAALNDPVWLVFPADVPIAARRVVVSAFVSAVGTVTITYHNATGAGQTPFIGGGSDWRVVVLKAVT